MYTAQPMGQAPFAPSFAAPPFGQTGYPQMAPPTAMPTDWEMFTYELPTESPAPTQRKEAVKREKKPKARRISVLAKIFLCLQLIALGAFATLELFLIHDGFVRIINSLNNLSLVMSDPILLTQFLYPCLLLLVILLCAGALISVLCSAKHARLFCRLPLHIEFFQLLYFPFASRVTFAGAMLGLSYPDAISLFFNSPTWGQDLLELYRNGKPYLPVGDGTYSLIYEVCLVAILLLGLVNLITFFFVNAPLRKAKKERKREKDEEIG